MLAAAYLDGEGRKQTEIASDLQLSQPVISRLLARARKKYLREEVHFLKEQVDEETMERILTRTSRSQLGELLDRVAKVNGQPRGPIVRVFSSGSRQATAADWEYRLKTFSQASAPYVKDLLLRSDVCGISWGQSLGHLVASLQGLPIPPPRADIPIRVIPLCGEPLGNAPTSYSSSNLAESLERLMNGKVVSNLSLSMVPAFIPCGFTECQLEGVWKLIGLVKAHEQIFGARKPAPHSPPPLVERVDMILTSVGPAERPLGYGSGELFRTGGMELEQLRDLLLGDISGVCIPKPTLSRKQNEAISNLNLRWTGISRSSLDSCARRSVAADPFTGAPGVCAVAIGRNKAPFTYEAVKLGLVNHLIIDEDLGDEIEKIARAESTKRELSISKHS
jgi:DNA-binding transcriptional regulator LsrR (DeoR family)